MAQINRAELDDAATARGGLSRFWWRFGLVVPLAWRFALDALALRLWRSCRCGQPARAAYGAHYINARSSMICKGVDGAGKRQAKDVRQAEFAADVLFPLDRRKANSEQVKSKWRAN